MNRRILLLFFVTASLISITGSKAVASCEEPKYEILESNENIEIRQYKDRIAAEVVTEGEQKRALDEGFVILSGYISGQNIRKRNVGTIVAPEANSEDTTNASLYRSESFAMTAPVMACASKANKWTIRIFMPSKYSLETLPTPDNERIKLVEIEPEKFAVLRFSGFSSKENFEKKAALLRNYLASRKIYSTAPEVDAYYDPPWILPFLRRNEVMIPLSQ